MTSIRATLVLLAMTFSSTLAAVEERLPGPWTVQIGWSAVAPDLSAAVGNKGILIGGGWRDEEDGLFGKRGVDVQYRTANRSGGRLDDLSAAYAERVPLENQVYVGAGAGLWISRIVDRRSEGDGAQLNIAPGVKGLVGYQFQPPNEDVRLALEIALLAIFPQHGYDPSGITVGLVAGF